MPVAETAPKLRSVYLDPDLDEVLRQAAFRRRVSKSELIRTFVEQGIEDERRSALEEEGIPPVVAAKPASDGSR